MYISARSLLFALLIAAHRHANARRHAGSRRHAKPYAHPRSRAHRRNSDGHNYGRCCRCDCRARRGPEFRILPEVELFKILAGLELWQRVGGT